MRFHLLNLKKNFLSIQTISAESLLPFLKESFMNCDERIEIVSPFDIHASAQSLIAFGILGFGNIIASNFSPWIHKLFAIERPTNWTKVFIMPTIFTILCAVILMLFFRDEKVKNR